MQWETPKAVFAEKALTYDGWQQDVLISIDGGTISNIEANATCPANTHSFPLILAGMSNLHSHAFQRAMAGLAEKRSNKTGDSFWSWREVMYDFLGKLTPDDIENIATQLYTEMLQQGYTAVGEFHYLHHDANGKPYANAAEMSERIIAAAKKTGIHLTHLPVMYETSDFGGKPAGDGQRRFIHNADDYITLLETLTKQQSDGMNLGACLHSLRAVTPESIARILEALPSLGLDNCPIHIHIAEQIKEVEACKNWGGKRPVEWLLKNHVVNERWCLIHATHMTNEEISAVAKSGAVAGLCPTTEANLGDGIFPAETYVQAGGAFGVGSDSHISVSPWEELKLLEYGQRLAHQRRAVLCSEGTPSVGRFLYGRAAKGGAQALGLKGGVIQTGMRADLIAPALDHPLLENKADDAILDTLIFATTPTITDVFVAGKKVI